MKIAITSGGFDPIHRGHIEYLQKAKKLFGYNICILNSDNFLKLKKGKPFMNLEDRIAIMNELKCIDRLVISEDKDLTVCETLKVIRDMFPNDDLYFVKGGDRFSSEIPEVDICAELNIALVDGIGKKIESSSHLIERSKSSTSFKDYWKSHFDNAQFYTMSKYEAEELWNTSRK